MPTPEEEELEAAKTDEEKLAEAEQAETEAKARRLGWVPIAEWRGSETDWRPAEEFLARAASNQAIFNERFEDLDKRHAADMAKVTGELTETRKQLEESTAVLGEIHGRFKQADKDAIERYRQRLDAEMAAAVEESDTPRYNTAKEKRDVLDKQERDRLVAEGAEERKPAADPAGKPNGGSEPAKRIPEVDAWVDKNEWFKNGKTWVKDAADAIHKRLLEEKPKLSLAENLEEVTKEMKSRFPEQFENELRRAPSTTVRPSGDRTTTRKGKSLHELGPEAEAAYAKLKKHFKTTRNVDYTPEMYIEDYAA